MTEECDVHSNNQHDVKVQVILLKIARLEWLCALKICPIILGKQTINNTSANSFCLTMKHSNMTIANNMSPVMMLWV